MGNPTTRKLLVVQAAALGHEFLTHHRGVDWDGVRFEPLQTVFPAVTATAQATFRTAQPPAVHGVTANGFFDRTLHRTFFWEQSSALVEGPRIWDTFRSRGGSVAMLFWQQSLGESVDMVLSPAPIHKHHGGMIEDCASQPPDLYTRMCRATGRPFRLLNYWGPLASARASQWIAEATAALLQEHDAPDLCLTYLPALDYDLQRYGPDHPRSARALDALFDQLALLRRACEASGHAMVVFGDYAIAPCHTPVYPNRTLADAGLLATRDIRGMQYVDLHRSRAFALVDHEIAHIYLADQRDLPTAAAALRESAGIGEVLDGRDQAARGVQHARGGELLLVADEGCWLAYPWWTDRRAAPDYATHVDIHSKPGYDPCELFAGWPPGTISINAQRIRGSHGRAGPARATAWAGLGFDATPNSLAGLGEAVVRWLDS